MTDAKTSFLVAGTAIVDRDATTAWASFETLDVTGSSKRAPEDEHLPEVGRDLALADMFEKLAVKLLKRAQGRANTAENNRRQRRASAERRETLKAAKARADDPWSYEDFHCGGVYTGHEEFKETEYKETVAALDRVTAEYREAFRAALDEMKKRVGPFRP